MQVSIDILVSGYVDATKLIIREFGSCEIPAFFDFNTSWVSYPAMGVVPHDIFPTIKLSMLRDFDSFDFSRQKCQEAELIYKYDGVLDTVFLITFYIEMFFQSMFWKSNNQVCTPQSKG
jgi:hypothetical protein